MIFFIVYMIFGLILSRLMSELIYNAIEVEDNSDDEHVIIMPFILFTILFTFISPILFVAAMIFASVRKI